MKGVCVCSHQGRYGVFMLFILYILSHEENLYCPLMVQSLSIVSTKEDCFSFHPVSILI